MFCYLLRKVLCRLCRPAAQQPRPAAGWQGQTAPAASRAPMPPLLGSRTGLPLLCPPWRQEIPNPLSQHPRSHTGTTLCCHPGEPNHPQLLPNAAETGGFLVSERFTSLTCSENTSPAEDASAKTIPPPELLAVPPRARVGQPGSPGLRLKVCISLMGSLNYLIFLAEIEEEMDQFFFFSASPLLSDLMS